MGAPAEKVVLPAVFETTGGARAGANRIFRFLSEVEFPGDAKDDPGLRRSRALWVSRQRKRHSLQLVRVKTSIMLRKRNLIRRQRAVAVCVPKGGGGVVGMSRIDIHPSKSGLPSGARFSAEAGPYDFDGQAIARGVPDDTLVA